MALCLDTKGRAHVGEGTEQYGTKNPQVVGQVRAHTGRTEKSKSEFMANHLDRSRGGGGDPRRDEPRTPQNPSETVTAES